MKKFIIEKPFWNIFPEATIVIVKIKDVKNIYENKDIYEKLLNQSIIESKLHLTEEDFSENTIIKKWREAYQQFKTKKGARSSIEALLKRVNCESSIGLINPLVDLYNCASLKFGVPCGGEDIDKISGNMLLTQASGGEHFMTLGADKSEPPYEEEIVYKDDEGAICRCLNWRESTRTMLTDQTKNAVFVFEEIGSDSEQVIAAANWLANSFKEILKVEPVVEVLNSQNHTTDL